MISPMHISESASGIVLSYPWWCGAALISTAVALALVAAFCSTRLRRRWPITLAAFVAAWAGIYVATFQATITNESGSAYAFLRYDHTIRWKDATDIYLEHRGAGRDWQIIVVDRERRVYNFDVAELAIEDRDRVMGYMVDRMPQSAFQRPPELLKRRSAEGTRPAGFFGDQQI
jgi:hypothetical protein